MADRRPDCGGVDEAARGAERAGGTVGVAIIAPGGEAYTRQGERRFAAASTVKIPIMVEVYRRVERGELSLADPYTLQPQDKAPGSGVLLHLHDGMGLTLRDLVYLMISISDNTATNVLIDLVGMAAVNETMGALGMGNSRLARKMRGRPAGPDEPENWATPGDYAAIVAAILAGRAASAESCAAMVAMLEGQQNRRRIARHLPEREGIRWGSKTGSIAGVTNDVGFIGAGGANLIVSAFCEGLPDQHAGEAAIGAIARAAMLATAIVEPSYAS